jgi:hypothetical protein
MNREKRRLILGGRVLLLLGAFWLFLTPVVTAAARRTGMWRPEIAMLEHKADRRAMLSRA